MRCNQMIFDLFWIGKDSRAVRAVMLFKQVYVKVPYVPENLFAMNTIIVFNFVMNNSLM